MATIGEIAVNVIARTNQFESSIKSSQMTLASFGSAALGIASQVGAALGGMFAIGRSFSSLLSIGDELDKMAARTGQTVESLSRLRFAAQMSDVSMQQMQTSIIMLNRMLLMRPKSFRDALNEIGVSIDSLQAASGEGRLAMLADGLDGISDGGRRAALATQLFGRAGASMLPMLAGGSEGLNSLTAEADRLGITMSTETSKGAALLGDQIAALKGRMQALGMSVAASLLPMLNGLLSLLLSIDQTSLKTVIGMTAFAASVYALSRAIPSVLSAIKSLSSLMSGLIAKKIALLALQGPSGWAILAGSLVAAASAGALFYGIINDITSQTSELATNMEQVARQTEKATESLVRYSTLANTESNPAAISARRRAEINAIQGTPITVRSLVRTGGQESGSLLDELQTSNDHLAAIESNTRTGIEINEVDL